MYNVAMSQCTIHTNFFFAVCIYLSMNKYGNVVEIVYKDSPKFNVDNPSILTIILRMPSSLIVTLCMLCVEKCAKLPLK